MKEGRVKFRALVNLDFGPRFVKKGDVSEVDKAELVNLLKWGLAEKVEDESPREIPRARVDKPKKQKSDKR